MKKFALPLFLFLLIPILTQAEPIRWQSYQDGMKKAKAENKKIFLNFHADW
jgi:thiol:disulfide interchange protein